MPLQNRVTPFGELVAVAERGTLMGNRGCLHDNRKQIRRAFQLKRWITCRLEFRGRRREVMRRGHYTELFFLDEATSFAAGHRPCAECRRDRYTLFRDLWVNVNAVECGPLAPRAGHTRPGGLTAGAMDDVLHAERLGPDGGKKTYPARLSDLPAGVMVVGPGNTPHLIQGSAWAPWTPGGYGPAVPLPTELEAAVLTPASVVRVIAAGYEVEVKLSEPERQRRRDV